MRNLTKVLAGATAAVAAAGVLGLAGTAQAQTGISILIHSSNVAAGVNTAVKLQTPVGCTAPVTVTGFPAPNGTTTDLQQVSSGVTTKLVGVWPPPSPDPQTFKLTVKCANAKSETENVVDASSPATSDVVGVGSDTIQNVMDQFSADYNASHTSGRIYSFDATNPVSGVLGDTIVTKHTSTDSTTCSQPRPNGSSAGITALENTKSIGSSPCIDFARSSRAPSPTDPKTITFINLAGDAVTYATQPGTHAPADLTAADLTGIYNCSITKWNQIPGNSGGSTDTIDAFIPQAGSGTRSFFLTAIGLTAPGTCVSTSATQAGAAGAGANTLEENEGVAPSLNGATGTGGKKADVIFPFSVGKYLAEHFHSASCGGVAGCYPKAVCHPGAGQNLFGCDTHGTMNLNGITEGGGTVSNPTTPFPPVKSSTINPSFDVTFTRLLFEVVNQPAGDGSIPANLAPYFGPTGFTCTNSTAKTDLANYGFLVLPAGTSAGDCGASQAG